MWEVTVDKEKCTGDEECVDVCPVDVFEMVDGKADPVNADECLGCESCVESARLRRSRSKKYSDWRKVGPAFL
jgi:ferredoxin